MFIVANEMRTPTLRFRSRFRSLGERTGWLLCASFLWMPFSRPMAAAEVGFNRDIRPILSNTCFACHGPDEKKRAGGLRLDVREEATAVMESGRTAIVPGQPDESELMRRVLVHDEDEQMPPPEAKRPPLSDKDVATLKTWIRAGAPYEVHWAFQPVKKTIPPTVRQETWIRNDIDRFILSRLEAEGIAPSPEADPATLARRLALDLTGLPIETAMPASEQAAGHYESFVESQLASPHHGERWGRHWLDQARYADSNGYAIDGDRPMWPFRDWVITAINDDLPFDQFTIDQLAGDLLPEATKFQRAATAFHRNTLINEEGGVDPEQFRVESVVDRVRTTGTVWLGLTIGCAQCHTHKYDPLTHKEYHQLLAYFNSGTDRNDKGATIPIVEGELLQRTPVQAVADEGAGDPVEKPVEPPRTAHLMVMEDLPEPRETYVMIRGDFTRPDRETGSLTPGIPAIFGTPLSAEVPDPHSTRLDLARWLVSPNNPLTARVTVNRVWMRYFGRGLVETEEDFGTQGTPPSHPELLDWLAAEFIKGGWSMKALHRLIVTSATYRQSSRNRPDLIDKDPQNVLLARQSRLRVEAEIIRDLALSAGGLLNRKIGGPSVRPPQPEGVYAFTQQAKKWETSTGSDRYRRGLYTFFYRSAPYPLFGTFDAPDFQTTCTRRSRSNTPLQSLALANDPVFLECSRGLAHRVMQDVPGPFLENLESRLARAFVLTLHRPASPRELNLLHQHAQRQWTRFQAAPTEAAAMADTLEEAVLTSAARVLLNLDSFITRE